jgi:hypothetical protein
VSDSLFWGTLLLLCGSTIWTLWRTRGVISAALLVPLAWIVLIPVPVILRPYGAPSGLFPDGFTGAPRDHMYTSIALANLAFTGFQWLVLSRWFEKLRTRLMAFFGARDRQRGGNGDRLLRKWVLGLSVVAIALAVIHLALMPRVPAWDLVTGFADPLQPNYDRETADKFLPVPTLIRYVFDWNQGIVFPILFAATVLMRWRPLAILIGIVGFIYVTSTLEKFPSIIFIAAPFIAVAVRSDRRIWSRVVVGGLALSLLGPLAINQAPGISTSIHQALHNVPPASATPTYDSSITTPVTGCGGVTSPAVQSSPSSPFSWRDLPASIKDILIRRIGAVPAEVTYGWFAYFPAQQAFLNGSGWEPWKVLAPGYRNPANAVGLWMYCGHTVTLPSVSAYGSFIADSWGEFGYLGVLLGCLGMVLFGMVLELIRGFLTKPFFVACYAPSVLLFASLPPRAGVLATIVSSGLWLVPVLCALFLASQNLGGSKARQAVVLEHAGS